MANPPPGGWARAPDLLKDRMGTRASRFRRKRDTGKPTRPVTAYDIFFRNVYPWLKGRRPDLTQQQLFCEVGRMWRETTSWEDRQICYDFADQEKGTYDKEMSRYKRDRERRMEKDRKARAAGQAGQVQVVEPAPAQPQGRARARDHCHVA